MEGGAALVDDVSRVLTFYDRGVRVISLTHLNNNELGGSGSPSIPLTNLSLQGDAGLTELGRVLWASTRFSINGLLRRLAGGARGTRTAGVARDLSAGKGPRVLEIFRVEIR